MVSCDSWRLELVIEPTPPPEVIDRIRTEFETALNRFTDDVAARLRHEFRSPGLRVRPRSPAAGSVPP